MTCKRHDVAISSSFTSKHYFFTFSPTIAFSFYALLPSMKAIPQATVKEAIGLMKDGATVRETAECLKISKSTAERIRLQEKENIGERQRGRPRKISADVVQSLKVNMKRGVLKSAVEAKDEANRLLVRPVSVTTVRRRLKEAGLLARKLVKRPALKKEHIKGRLHFVKKYREWTEDDWARVVWSDECKVNRICSDGLRYVWDDNPERITTHSVQGTVKFGGGSVCVWSCMSWHGPGYITMIDETLDSELYIKILQEDLQMSMDEWGIAKEELVFQHDNDPKHTAKITKRYLESVHMTEAEGTLLYWPAQSPDLNPIEHMWTYLKRQLGKYPTRPKSCKELWQRISAEWYKIPVDKIRNGHPVVSTYDTRRKGFQARTNVWVDRFIDSGMTKAQAKMLAETSAAAKKQLEEEIKPFRKDVTAKQTTQTDLSRKVAYGGGTYEGLRTARESLREARKALIPYEESLQQQRQLSYQLSEKSVPLVLTFITIATTTSSVG